METTSSALRRQVRRSLLNWFRRSRRDLPWRQNRDPYRIWVSEIMLQQTQVATVVPYFERFLNAFPTVQALAAAEEQAVLRLWEGLGYYRRARNLHQAAQRVVAEFGSQIPDDPAALQRLPGIGRYTMGAILSQAFDQRLPILEANSQRVLARLLAFSEDLRRGPARRRLWEAAEALLPSRKVGEFNQALMELGALVCTPQTPRCPGCPLASVCEARRLGIQKQIPHTPAVLETIAVEEAAVVIHRGRKVLLVQRPPNGRWAGLWEFPHAPLANGESYEATAARLASDLAGIQATIGPELRTLRHGIMHYRITLVCFDAQYRAGRFRSTFYRQGRWLRTYELGEYPVSSPQRRLAQALLRPARQQQLF
jgi:A/G-specific adenine glycosylase